MIDKVEGRIIVLKEMVQITDTFSKREIVIETEDDKYPQKLLVQFTQDGCSLVDNYSVGDDVEISVNLGGRLWTSPQGEDRYFLSLNGWKIDKQGEQTVEQEVQQGDDLPF